MKQNKRVIGITGGVGCGKSTVMTILREHFFAKTILADEVGHEALQKGTATYCEIVKIFGDNGLLPDGRIDRSYLADVIYQDEYKRQELNAIIHPYVWEKISEFVKREETAIVAIETALMFETGCDTLCDEVWYVKTEAEIRIRRLMDSRGYTREKAEAIMAAQLSEEDCLERSDAVIENNGSIEKIVEQLQELLGTT